MGYDTGIYNRSVGQPGVMLPWRDAAAVHMAKDGIDEPTLYLPILWYAHDELTAEIRLAYMDAVTLLWKENFSARRLVPCARCAIHWAFD